MDVHDRDTSARRGITDVFYSVNKLVNLISLHYNRLLSEGWDWLFVVPDFNFVYHATNMYHHLLQKLIQSVLDNSLNYVFTIEPPANHTQPLEPRPQIVDFKLYFFGCCQLFKKLLQALIEQFLYNLLHMLATNSITICRFYAASLTLLPEIIHFFKLWILLKKNRWLFKIATSQLVKMSTFKSEYLGVWSHTATDKLSTQTNFLLVLKV